MAKIYKDSEDVNVSVRILYADSLDGPFYYDSEKTRAVADESEVGLLFANGVVITLDGVNFTTPIGLGSDGFVYFEEIDDDTEPVT